MKKESSLGFRGWPRLGQLLDGFVEGIKFFFAKPGFAHLHNSGALLDCLLKLCARFFWEMPF